MGSSEGHGCPEFLVTLLVSRRKERKTVKHKVGQARDQDWRFLYK